MPLRPALPLAVAIPVPQKKLAQPVTPAQQIFLGVLPGSHQVAQRLLTFVRNPDQRQLPGTVQPPQLVRISIGARGESGVSLALWYFARR